MAEAAAFLTAQEHFEGHDADEGIAPVYALLDGGFDELIELGVGDPRLGACALGGGDDGGFDVEGPENGAQGVQGVIDGRSRAGLSGQPGGYVVVRIGGEGGDGEAADGIGDDSRSNVSFVEIKSRWSVGTRRQRRAPAGREDRQRLSRLFGRRVLAELLAEGLLGFRLPADPGADEDSAGDRHSEAVFALRRSFEGAFVVLPSG